MSDANRYVLDSNVLITASNTYYGFDLCPGFWSALLRAHAARRVVSIDKVKAEIAPINDGLKEWATKTVPKDFFKKTEDVAVIRAFSAMLVWVQSQTQFTPAAKAEFANVADGWVIAYANANHLVVVTHEEFAPDAKKKVPMPNLCVKFGVEYANTFEMLRDLQAQFDLRKKS